MTWLASPRASRQLPAARRAIVAIVFALGGMGWPSAASSQSQGTSCNTLNKVYSPTWMGHNDNLAYICDGSQLQTLWSATAIPLALGIGTSSPVAGLDVLNPITSASGNAYGGRYQQTLTASANGDALTALYINPSFTDGSYSGVANNGLIVANGNVGIGTSLPAQMLSIAGSNPTFGLYNVSDGGYYGYLEDTYSTLYLGITASGTYSHHLGINQTGAVGSVTNQGVSAPVFRNVLDDGSGIAYFTGGNVGIGTATPDALLRIVGPSNDSTTFIKAQLRSGNPTGNLLDLRDSTATVLFAVGGFGNIVSRPLANGTNTFIVENTGGTAIFDVDSTNGRVGIGTTAPGTALDVNGGLTTEPTSVTLTANNTVLSTANRSYFRVTSDNTTATNRIFCMGSGTAGQLVTIEWTSATNKGEIVDGGTCSAATGAVASNLSATWVPAAADATIELIYNGTKWLQIAVSAN
jgi:hypothetical protein